MSIDSQRARRSMLRGLPWVLTVSHVPPVAFLKTNKIQIGVSSSRWMKLARLGCGLNRCRLAKIMAVVSRPMLKVSITCIVW
jgi:hypothetical protein